MSNVSRFPYSPPPQPDASADAQSDAIATAICTLLNTLSAEHRERVLEQVTGAVLPIAAPRAKGVLGTSVRLLPEKRNWTVEEVKKRLAETEPGVGNKEIYNAFAYLTRRQYIRRVGYGRYLVEGGLLAGFRRLTAARASDP